MENFIIPQKKVKNRERKQKNLQYRKKEKNTKEKFLNQGNCSLNGFKNEWNYVEPNKDDTCINQVYLYNNDTTSDTSIININNTNWTNIYNYNIFCWLYQKTPGANEIFSIIYSNYIPTIKIFMIARYPVKQLFSIIFKWHTRYGISSNYDINNKNNISIYKYIYNHLNKHINQSGMNLIQIECKKFINFYDQSVAMRMNLSNIELLKELKNRYQKMIKLILYQKYVKNLDAKDIDTMKDLDTKSALKLMDLPKKAVIFHKILFWIYAYDEKYGFYSNIWNQFRIIQHEWMFNDVSKSFGVIKCWLQYNKQIIFDNHDNINANNDNLYLFEECNQIYFNNKNYFKYVNNRINIGTKNNKASSTSKNKFKVNAEIDNKTKQLFDNYYLNLLSL